MIIVRTRYNDFFCTHIADLLDRIGYQPITVVLPRWGRGFFFFTEFYRVSPTTAGEGVEKKQTADGNVLMRIHPFLCLSLSLSLSLATYLSREEERKEARKGNKKEDLHDIDDAR